MAGKFKSFIDMLLGRSSSNRTLNDTRTDEVEDTFVSATGGGWNEAPEVIQADGGEYRDYVAEQLERARQQADKEGLKPGDVLRYRLVDIPRGIVSPHEISFGMMIRASEYGFTPGVMNNELINLTVR